VLAANEPGAPSRQGSSLYRLQLGSFRQPANAEDLRARLAAAGFAAEMERAEAGITRVVLRGVRAAELASVRRRLAAAGWPDALVRLEP
jgi:cell division protein FtsN